jgi:hypothetical protein
MLCDGTMGNKRSDVNYLFECGVKVHRGPGCEMPSHLVGAIVSCYMAAPDYQEGLRQAVAKLKSMGYLFEDVMDGKVRQLDPSRWDRHVASTWPELVGYFPPQADLPRFIEAGGVFLGPFCSFESQ